MEIHDAANAFPMMDGKRYQELLEDIQEHGLREPITLCDGKILDGRNRYKACQELEITPQTKDFDGDPWAYVWSLNGQRRDLVQEQRYQVFLHCVAASEAWQGEQKLIQEEANRKRSEAAKAQPRTETGIFQPVVDHSEPPPVKKHKTREAKAKAARVNKSTVARGDTLKKERPALFLPRKTQKLK